MNDQSRTNRSGRASSEGHTAPQFDASKARSQGAVPEESEGGSEEILASRGTRRLYREPEHKEVNWYEFTFDAAHPEDDAITLRFVIEVPVPPARDLPGGAILESQIRWREEVSRGL